MAAEGSKRVGDYEVLALLGTGGMGRVYKVRNVITNREEAMKVLLPDFASEPELANRFMSEIRTLAGLDHPNIAQLRTAFQVENQLVMVMEYVEGTNLDTLAGEKRVPVDQVLEYSLQVLSALSYAHGHGVIHRDIKPANIMITPHGLVKLMDFGIAKSATDMHLTRPGTTMGSVYYMSPEQVRGDTVDARSDLYSFGVTLYEMLTGRKPFNADTSFSVLNAQVNEAPMPPVQVNPELPGALNDLVLCAMAKKPAERFQTAEEFRNALKALREPRTAPVAPAPTVAAVPVAAAEAVPQATQAGWQAVPAVGQPVVPPAAQQPAAQGYVPVAVAPAARQGTGKSHRGLWIGLGALTAIVALVAVVALLPHLFSTLARQKQAAADTQTSATTQDAKSGAPSTPAADTTPAAPTGGTASPEATPVAATATSPATTPTAVSNASQPARPAYKGSSQSAAGGSSGPVAGSSVSAPSNSGGTATPAAPAGPSAQEIREAHDRLMNLDARAETATSGVQQIRNQQQAQGLDIRGDILGAMARARNNLGAANRSLGQNDLNAANEYMEKADRDIAALEKFLGR